MRGRLTIAFLLIVVLFSLATLASDAGFRKLRGSLDEIHEETLPRVLALQEVGLRVPELLRMAATVRGEVSLSHLLQIEENLEATTLGLEAAVTSSGPGAVELGSHLHDIEANLRDLFAAKRVEIDANDTVMSAAAKFARDASDLAERMEGALILAESGGADAKGIRDMRIRLLTIITELRAVPDAESESSLASIERSYELARREAVRLLGGLDASIRASSAAEFQSLLVGGSDPASLFSLRRSALRAAKGVQATVDSGRELGAQLQASAAALVGESRAAIEASRSEALVNARGARLIEISLFLAALVSSGLIVWLYVHGRVVRRLEQLSGDMGRLSRGDLDVRVQPGGDREVAQLAQAAEVFRQNARQLERTLKTLETRNATLNEFAYVASHDLKSPMRAIANLASWVRDDSADDLSDESKEHLVLMAERIVKMETLLEDLLRYSRLGNDEQIVEILHLSEVLDDVLGLLALPPQVSVISEGTDVSLRAIAAPLKLCLRNLIQNAFRHSDQDKPCIRIIASQAHSKDQLKIVVEDNGPGIPERQREEAFRIFRKLNHGGVGTGMGLALARRAIELIGGSIAIESAEPRGARIVLYWPLDAPTQRGPAPGNPVTFTQTAE